MTKQEKIQEAYGEWFEEMKPWINIDGWFDKNAFYNKVFSFNYEKIDVLFSHCQDLMIPKSIREIDKNHGWVKIGEDDLIHFEGDLWGLTKNKEVFFFSTDEFIEKGLLTHYQPIVKPGLPLY